MMASPFVTTGSSDVAATDMAADMAAAAAEVEQTTAEGGMWAP